MAKICVEQGGYYFLGNGQYGVTGNGTESNVPVWTEMNGNYKRMETGHYNVYGIKNDNTLWAWGRGDQGMLGNGQLTPASSPIQIPGEWCCIYVGQITVYGKKTDGTFWGWGNQNNLNLAVGCTTSQQILSTPVPFNGNFNNITYFSSSSLRTAIGNNGSNYIWGCGSQGGNGNCSTVNLYTPTIPCHNSRLWVVGCGGYTYTLDPSWRFAYWGAIPGKPVCQCAQAADATGLGAQGANLLLASCSDITFVKSRPSGVTLTHFGARENCLLGTSSSGTGNWICMCNHNTLSLTSLYGDACISRGGVICNQSGKNCVGIWGLGVLGQAYPLYQEYFPKPIYQPLAGYNFMIAKTCAISGEFNKNDNSGAWTLNKVYKQKINDAWSDFVPTIDD